MVSIRNTFSFLCYTSSMESEEINKKAWNNECKNNNYWTQIVKKEEIVRAKEGNANVRVTTTKAIPSSWLEKTKNMKTLVLCGGGGQQTPLLAAYGAIVTSLDISPMQIEQDKKALKEYSLNGKCIVGSALSLPFEDSSFSAIINPISLNFVPSLDKAYSEIDRVLEHGGYFMMGIANPVLYIFDEKKQKKKLKVKYTLPFSTEKAFSTKELERKAKNYDTYEYSYTLEEIIGGLLKRGFVLIDFFTDKADSEPTDSFIYDSFLAFLFKKE